jgi:hypothetical protein
MDIGQCVVSHCWRTVVWASVDEKKMPVSGKMGVMGLDWTRVILYLILLQPFIYMAASTQTGH